MISVNESVMKRNMKPSSGKIKQFMYEKRWFLLMLAFVVVFAIIPLLTMNIFVGHDTQFHINRIEALAQEMQMGNFFPRMYSTAISGNGYATPLFYGDLFLLIPAFLYGFCGVSIYASLTIFMIMLFLAVSVSMYCCVYNITQNKASSCCAAVLFALSSYFCTDMFARGAIGEAQAFVFLPITFLGFYNILYRNMEKWYLLPIGLALMIHVHLLSSVMTVFVFVLLMLFSFDKVIKEPKKILYLAISALVFLVLSVDFILPMLEQLISTTLMSSAEYPLAVLGPLAYTAMPSWAVFCDFTIFTTYYKTINYFPNGISIAIILLIGYLLFYKRTKNRLIWHSLIISGLFIVMATKLFPWSIFLDVFGIMQFPWRLLIYPTFFVALAAGVYFGSIDLNKKTFILMGAMIAVSLFSYCVNLTPYFMQYNKFTNGGQQEVEYIEAFGLNDYLPIMEEYGESTEPYMDELRELSDTIVCSSDDIVADFVRKDGKLIVNFKNNTANDATIEVPILMYKGYTATLDDGTNLECDYGQYNRIKVSINDINEGTFVVEYTGTVIQHVSRVISIVAVLGLAAYLVIDKIKFQKSKI